MGWQQIKICSAGFRVKLRTVLIYTHAAHNIRCVNAALRTEIGKDIFI